jgi:putative ABC transport system substrate-binding protein
MKRRKFFGIIGGAALAWPFGAGAQQSAPALAFLHSGTPEQNVKRLAAFHKGLCEQGFVDGQNLRIEYRWADRKLDRLPALADELVAHKPAAMFTDTRGAVAAKAATTTIPIVFVAGGDPVALGLVSSINRPDGNLTGVTSANADLAAKRLSVLRELVPKASHYFSLVNPGSVLTDPFINDLQTAARTLGIQVEILQARTDAEIDAAFANIPRQPGALLVFPPDAFFYTRRAHLAELTTGRGLPAIFDVRDYVEAGGLVNYGMDFLNVMQIAGNYAGRLLKGEKPGELPVQQTTKFELVINLKAAKSLGIEVPPTLLASADDVIE